MTVLLQDTVVMTKRSLRHTVRSMDTIITVAIMPIAMMLLFVYVLRGSFGDDTDSYVNYITPGIAIMCVVSGIAYAALRLNNDLTNGIIGRFRAMPVAPSSILGGHAMSSLLSNLFSVFLVLAVAVIIGFRPNAGIAEWLMFLGILALFTLATTWLAIVFGLLASSPEGAGAFSYLLLLGIFVSSAFTPVDRMASGLRWFAENQPMTPIIETMRSLLTAGTPGDDVWIAIGWCIALLIGSYAAALRVYRTKSA